MKRRRSKGKKKKSRCCFKGMRDQRANTEKQKQTVQERVETNHRHHVVCFVKTVEEECVQVLIAFAELKFSRNSCHRELSERITNRCAFKLL